MLFLQECLEHLALWMLRCSYPDYLSKGFKTLRKWPPLDMGTRIKISKPIPNKRKEFTSKAILHRKWGVTGTIIMHDSHGLCYDVKHDDGTTGSYDPKEFTLI